MRYTTASVAIGCAMFALVSCKQSTSPTLEGSLSMEASIDGSTVTSMMIKGERVEGTDVDSVRITRVRMLLSRIKMKRSDEDTMNGGRDVKAGPAVVTWEKGKISTVFATTVPVGKYDRIKLEVHRFTPVEAAAYSSNATFADFATEARPTFIVEGTVWSGGTSQDFVQTSDNTENQWVAAEPYVEVTESTPTKLTLNFDAATWLKVGGKVKDPRDGTIRDDLRSRLKSLFKLLRKS